MTETPSEHVGTAEQITDEDRVSRLYRDLDPEIAPESALQFPYDKNTGQRAESLIWRKHAPELSDVHQRGCSWKKDYIGCRTSDVGPIRQIRSRSGHSFAVEHEVEGGDFAHVAITISPTPGVSVKGAKNDLAELRHKLHQQLGELEPHQCESESDSD